MRVLIGLGLFLTGFRLIEAADGQTVQRLEAVMAEHEIPGASVAVVKDGRVADQLRA